VALWGSRAGIRNAAWYGGAVTDARAATAANEPGRAVAIALLVGYLILFTALAIAPHERAVWWAENIPIVAIVATLTLLFARGVRFSTMAYVAMSVLIYLHTIGGHYTFERVPFGWVTDAFGFERNHFDRIAHFSVGFYAFAIAELSLRRSWVGSRAVAYFFSVFAIATVAALYEIIEWLYAALEGGDAGAAFLGSQGDIWDAQKDMLADISGAVFAIAVHGMFGRAERTRRQRAAE
jgi:putative membrane protein